MFSKSVFVCFLAFYLVQPNEAIFGLDAVIESAAASAATSANTEAQAAASQAITALTTLQGNMSAAVAALNPQITTALNAAIAQAVTAASGDPTKTDGCILENQTQLTAFSISTLQTITNACLNVNLNQAIALISTASSLANNLTNAVVNLNNTVADACPPPASGDLLGGVANAVCTVTVFGVVAGDLALQTAGVSGSLAEATALASSISTTLNAAQACVTAQVAQIAPSAASVISPIVLCTLIA